MEEDEAVRKERMRAYYQLMYRVAIRKKNGGWLGGLKTAAAS